VTAIRNMRVEKQVDAKRKIAALIAAGGDAPALLQLQHALSVLAGVDPGKLEIIGDLRDIPEDSVPTVVHGIEIYLPLKGLLDPQEEAKRLRAQLEEAKGQIERLEELLAGPFADRAPKEVVKKERERLQAFQETASKLKAQIEGLPES
jgi:valyl-tRNA synthetase